jgi:hypothetical protein
MNIWSRHDYNRRPVMLRTIDNYNWWPTMFRTINNYNWWWWEETAGFFAGQIAGVVAPTVLRANHYITISFNLQIG